MEIGEIATAGNVAQANGQPVNGRPYTPARGVGRPSTVVQYAPQVGQWLQENPTLSGAEILRRIRLVGYRGGKSALYELVRRLRSA